MPLRLGPWAPRRDRAPSPCPSIARASSPTSASSPHPCSRGCAGACITSSADRRGKPSANCTRRPPSSSTSRRVGSVRTITSTSVVPQGRPSSTRRSSSRTRRAPRPSRMTGATISRIGPCSPWPMRTARPAFPPTCPFPRRATPHAGLALSSNGRSPPAPSRAAVCGTPVAGPPTSLRGYRVACGAADP